jgi:putative endonuclease
MHFVYIVRCGDGTLYTGYARDPKEREQVHNAGRGAKYTASRLPVSLAYFEEVDSMSAALKREHQVKQWTRARKEALIASGAVSGPPLPERLSGAEIRSRRGRRDQTVNPSAI